MKIPIPAFDTARVLVVGDVMLDRYWHGVTARISPEAPVPVVRVDQGEERPGGAGNVALNIAALGGRVTLQGLTGKDEAAELLAEQLRSAGVECALEPIEGFHTITKLRVLSRHQQLIRLDFEDGFEGFQPKSLLDRYQAELARCDVIVLSDYGKGTLQPIRPLIESARNAGKTVLVDPKSRDFSLYRDASLITPNLAEFEAVVGPCFDEADLVDKGMLLLQTHTLDGLLITRGEHGMTLLQKDQAPLHLPTQAREVFDVTGAGDTVISVLAAALAANQPLPEATALANLAAGIVVGKLGATTLQVAELRRALHESNDSERILRDFKALLERVHDARAHGETLVMTNGCFDILHSGHVGYLKEARQLGDRLLVAVNDDDSVRRLKGKSRPLNPLEDRMAVLAALQCVDWVMPFSEDTPEALICRVLPDYLVKGGDYRPEEIAGYECVTANGGKVVILAYRKGRSSSGIIDKMRRAD